MVTVADVRAVLGNIDTTLLTDEQIQAAINDAKIYVQRFIDGSNPLYEACVKYRAAYLALITYAEIARREVGDLPNDALLVMQQMKSVADEFLQEAKKLTQAGETTVPLPSTLAITTTQSSWDEVHDP